MGTSGTRRGTTGAAIALAIALAVAGCSGQDAESSGVDDAAGAPADEAGGGEGGAPGGGGLVDPEAIEAAADRDIIYTAEVSVRADDVDEAVRAASEAVRDLDGFVLRSEVVAQPDRRATISLRVPPAGFAELLDVVSALGVVERASVDAEDVTTEVVDLESRIASAEATIGRLRDLLHQAASLDDVVFLESELASREADLESFQAQLRVLSEQVRYSTIDLVVLGPDAPPTVAEIPGFLGGLQRGWVAFQNTVQVLLLLAGFLLPFVVAVAIVAVPIVVLVRRRRRRRGPRPPRRPPVAYAPTGPWPGGPAADPDRAQPPATGPPAAGPPTAAPPGVSGEAPPR